MVVEMLKEIKALTKELNIESSLELISEGESANILRINLEEECDLNQDLTIMIYEDVDELDGSTFIQFFSEYSFEIKEASLLYKKCSLINRNLSLGHFNLSPDEKKIQYRYMLAFPKESKMKATFLNDILDMALFAIDENQNSFS